MEKGSVEVHESGGAIQSVVPPGKHVRPVSRWRHLRNDVAESAKAFLRVLLKCREVREITRRPGLSEARILAVLVVKDEAPRLPFLLKYYRDLGVDHFLVVDNRSSDGVQALLADETDVSLYAADGDFKRARFGSDWVNGLLFRFGAGKWILWVDADEMLVFSRRSAADLRDLVAELDRRGQRSLQTLMVDMYSARPANQNVVDPGADPLAVCDLYDRSGYVCHHDEESGTGWIKGGVRGRLFFPNVYDGPALNKTPLVRWRRHYAFLKVAHQLWPRRLNGNGRVEGVLLHFKFTETSVRKMGDEIIRMQHTAEYDAYADVHKASFVGAMTDRFVSESGMADNGLFEPLI